MDQYDRRSFIKNNIGNLIACSTIFSGLAGCQSSNNPQPIQLLCYANANASLYPQYSSQEIAPYLIEKINHCGLINNEHTLFEKIKYIGKSGGYSELISTIARLKNKHIGPTLVIDGGSSWSSGALINSKLQKLLVSLSNSAMTDFMSLGNELTLPSHELKNYLELFKGTVVESNVSVTTNPLIIPSKHDFKTLNFMRPYSIKRFKNISIAFLGLANYKKFQKVNKIRQSPFDITFNKSSIQELIFKLKKERLVNYIVVLSQNSYELDVELLNSVEGIDILYCCNHSFQDTSSIAIKNSLMICSSKNLESVWQIFIPSDTKGPIYAKTIKLLSKEITPDTASKNFIAKMLPHTLRTPIGQTDLFLGSSTNQMNSIDFLISQSIANYFSVESVVGLSENRSPSFLPNEKLTLLDISLICASHFGFVSKTIITGKELTQILMTMVEENQNTNKSLNFQYYSIKLYGLTVTIHQDYANRIKALQIQIEGKNIGLYEKYQIAFWGVDNSRIFYNNLKIPLYDIVASQIQNNNINRNLLPALSRQKCNPVTITQTII
ncbi:MAG: hypothetical protein QM538_00805 [Methylacidiphilales bacterium]|nr:hypothetical protein [Candidatus Methylacidiphilales bacterium]